ncbi:SAM-dependent methyltransferase [Halapricum desulfuricans]|uniref:SAM-dependent methyltransferase n=1 Tax=Halapricum desulfuricans TaxID=2841257 RepID=A0A897NDL9_9EURY|nr:class I SAM-dependent methyltransferase [Halapricum desulfuricans]QSG10618.1 SAM-dependent methyltransferase [Halapricum desulfuricans]
MPKTAPFEEHTDRYEQWFETHEAAYRSELAALERLVSPAGDGIEIGVGSGRFAGPLGVDVGIDPSAAMLGRARERGIKVVRGVAESLPFDAATFDTVLILPAVTN